MMLKTIEKDEERRLSFPKGKLRKTSCDAQTSLYEVHFSITLFHAVNVVERMLSFEKATLSFQKVVRASLEYIFLPWYEYKIDAHILTTATGYKNVEVNGDTHRILELLARQLSKVLLKFPLDFSTIPAPILCGIVKPLDVVPQRMLMEAYRFQALSKPDIMRWDEFGHSQDYKIFENSLTKISCETHEFQGFARCNLGVDICNDRTAQWEMIILSPCESLHVGFFTDEFLPTLKSIDRHVLGDHEGSCALGSDGILRRNLWKDGNVLCHYCCERGCFDRLEGLRVGVLLDTEGFSFLINGKSVGDNWAMN